MWKEKGGADVEHRELLILIGELTMEQDRPEADSHWRSLQEWLAGQES